MATKVRGKWEIQIVGKLRIFSPDKEEIVLKSGKSRSLIALLVLHPGEYLSRQEIGEILWPKFTPFQQSENLRQAIAYLRRQLPDNSPFFFERHTCWIDRKYVTTTRIDDDLKRSTVLPDCDEPWFDSWRKYSLAHHSEVDERLHDDYASTESAIEALRILLDHTKILNPKATLKTIENFFDFAQGLKPVDAARIVTACILQMRSDEPGIGWGQLLRGIALTHVGKSIEGSLEIEKVKQISLDQKDIHLYIRAVFYQASGLIIFENPILALDLLKKAKKTVSDQVPPETVIHLYHGLGLAEIHNGNFSEGLGHLQRASDLSLPNQFQFEQAHVIANTAWMAATIGEVEIAKKRLQQLEKYVLSKSWRIMLTKLLASSMVSLHEGDFDSCKRDAIRVLNFTESTGAAAFAFYPHEILAVCYQLEKDNSSAGRHYDESKRIREEQNVIYTNWDLHRLRPLL